MEISTLKLFWSVYILTDRVTPLQKWHLNSSKLYYTKYLIFETDNSLRHRHDYIVIMSPS